MQPGRYTLVSDDPRYARAMGLAAKRRATIRGVRYLPDGRKAVVVVVHQGRKRNDQHMTLDPEYFQTALKDYERWPIKWWREAIQNAVDAKARNVECGVQTFTDRVTVWCEDDGIGMDRETLLTKFLRLGASGKRGDADAKGGFGKAKEMLLLPWLRWKVSTRDSLVEGRGISYTVKDQRSLSGTRLEVDMPTDNATRIELAEEFIRRCDLPRVKFTLHSQDFARGEEPAVQKVSANAKPGKAIRELEGKATVHYSPKGPHGFMVRTGGLWMFDRYMSSSVNGQVIMELTGRSIDLLTANRDGVRDYQLVREVDEYLNELASDSKSATKDKSAKQRKLYPGRGQFDARPPEAMEAELLAASSEALPVGRPSGETLAPQVLQHLVELLKTMGGGEALSQDGGMAVGVMPASAASVVLGSLPVLGQEHLERTLKQLAWQPDFYVVNEAEGFKPPRGLLPEKMNRAALRCAKVWTELCRWVLILLNSPMRFGVGWVFGESAGATYLREGGQDFLLLNPLPSMSDPSQVFDPARPKHLEWMVACAIHEATHMADGVSYHNEVFSSALTKNMATCARIWHLAPQLEAAIRGGADIELHRALQVEAPGKPATPGRARRPALEAPPPPQRLPWFADPVRASHAPATLTLTPERTVPRGHQMGLFAGRKANGSAKRHADMIVEGRQYPRRLFVTVVDESGNILARKAGRLDETLPEMYVDFSVDGILLDPIAQAVAYDFALKQGDTMTLHNGDNAVREWVVDRSGSRPVGRDLR